MLVRHIPLCAALLFAAAISPAARANKKPPPAPINLNTASSEQLQQVPGIGPATAAKILKMRAAYGPFRRVEDLRAIKGIGPKRLAKMRKYLTVSAAPAHQAAPARLRSGSAPH